MKSPIDPSMVWIPGGSFQMGSDRHYVEEAPSRRVSVDGFWMDPTPVTNAQFRKFVEQTGHVTFCELAPDPSQYPGALPELLKPSSVMFKSPPHRVDLRNPYLWWLFVPETNWRKPQGPESTIEGRDDYPVVHVTYSDIDAYARWAGKQIPTESEWEYAARGGLDGADYAWGDEMTPNGRHLANTWQGDFPWHNSLDDGFEGTSPVLAFPKNSYGLFDMIGNVWEWTSDWFATLDPKQKPKTCCEARNPRGGREEESYDPRQPAIRIPRKVMKGGSHLCSPNYCRRYRPAARMPQPVDTSTSHLGFRCVVRE